MDIATLGLNVDSRQAATAVKVLDDLAAAGGRAEKSTEKLTGATTGEAQALSKSRTEAAASAAAHDSLASSQNKAASASAGLGQATRVLGQALAALGIATTVRELVGMADAYTNINSRLGLVTSSTRELTNAQRALFTIAQETRTGFADLVGTYAQMSRSAKEFGASQNTMIGVTRTLSQAITISGASASSANAALVQLSQGFASGTLRGEELNSVMEQTPRVAQAIAEGMGITVGKLREMGQAGMLTAEAVVAALTASAASVDAEFGKMAVTVEGAMTRVSNSMLAFVGVMNEVTGASGAMAAGISAFSMGLDGLTDQIRTLKNVTGGDFWFALFKDEKFIQNNLTEAREDLAKFEAQFKKFPNSLYIRADVVEAREQVAKLEADLLRLRRISGGAAATDADPDALENRRRASFDREQKRQSETREKGNALMLKSSGVSASYVKEMQEVIRVYQDGGLTGEEYNRVLGQMQESLLKKTGATKAAKDADTEANKEAREQAKLIAELGGLTGSFTEDWARLNSMYAAGTYSLDQLTAAQARLLEKQPAVKAAHDAAAASLKEEIKSYDEAAKARMRMYDTMESGVDKLAESNANLRDEIELIGLTTAQQNAVIRARSEALLLTKEATLAELQRQSAITGTMTREEAALTSEIELLRERNSLLTNKDSREASARAVERQERQWLDMWESVDRTAHDVFVSVADSGEDAFKRIGKTIKASLLDMLYQMTVRKWVMSIFANVTGGGGVAAQAAQAAGGGANGLASLAGSPIGSAALGFIGNSGAFGAGLASGASQAAIGSAFVGPPAAAAGGAVGAGASLGAAVPYIGVALAVLSMLSGKFNGETRTGGQFGVAFDGSVTNARRGQTYTYEGQQFDRDFSGGNRNALVSGQAYRLEGDPVAQEEAIRGAVSGTAAGINAMLSALGSAAQVAAFSAGLETSGKGRGGVFSGGRLSTGALFGESGTGDNYAGTLYETTSTQSPDFQTALGNFTLDLKQATVQALQQATDIPRVIRDALAGVNAEQLTDQTADAVLTSISQQIEGVKNLKIAFDAMGMQNFAKLGFDAAAGMAAAAGGFDSLNTKLASYYQNYFTDAERTVNLTAQLTEQFGKLGFALPRSREEFRALVQANEALGDGGAKTVGELLNLADAFAQITNEASGANAAFQALEKSVSAENTALQKQRQNLSSQRDAQRGILDDLTTIFDLLGENIRELRGEVEGGAQMQAAQGRAFIAAALNTARASGYLPDADQLSEAIGAARGVLSDENFASRFEADRARAILSNELADLQEITGDQKTVAELTLEGIDTQILLLEKQIKQNEELLSYWKTQIEKADGSIAATLSVADAVLALTALMFPPAKPNETPTGDNGSGFSSGPSGGGGAVSAPRDKVAEVRDFLTMGGGSASEIGATAFLRDWSLQDLAAGSGYSVEQVGKFLGLPGYKVGTNYVPTTQLAVLHPGEAVVPKEYNPAAGGVAASGGSASDDVLMLLSKIEANTRAGALNANAINRLLQRIVPEGDAMNIRAIT